MEYDACIIIDGLEEVRVTASRERIVGELNHYLYQYKDDFKKTIQILVEPVEEGETCQH